MTTVVPCVRVCVAMHDVIGLKEQSFLSGAPIFKRPTLSRVFHSRVHIDFRRPFHSEILEDAGKKVEHIYVREGSVNPALTSDLQFALRSVSEAPSRAFRALL